MQPAELAEQLVWNGSLLTRWGTIEAPRLPFGLNYTQIAAMYLSNHGVDTGSGIARYLRITPRAVTSAADRLEDLGFVTRQPDRYDRRVIRFAVTEEGLTASQTVEGRAFASFTRKLAQLDPEDYRTLARSVRLLETLLSDVRSDAIDGRLQEF